MSEIISNHIVKRVLNDLTNRHFTLQINTNTYVNDGYLLYFYISQKNA